MTFSKYKRLCLVLIVPLLLASYLCARIFWPYDAYVWVLCEPFLGTENCRAVGPPDGALYKSVKNNVPAWFDFTTDSRDSKSYVRPLAESSIRVIDGAQIAAVMPALGSSPNAEAFMKTLPGLPASIVLGIQNAHPHSSVVSGVALLWCDALGYGESGTYSANCYSDTWQGRITFRVEGPGRMTLDNIRAETEKIVEKGNYEYRIYQVVMYPLFLYGFLLLSALVWLAARAFRFVKNG